MTNKKKNEWNSILKLAQGSVMAREFCHILESEMFCYKDISERILEKSYDVFTINQSNRPMFFPNGNSGCVMTEDGEKLFGIDCRRLIWIEGNCGGYEDFWTEDDHDEADGVPMEDELIHWNGIINNPYLGYKAILVVGNNRGNLVIKLIVFHDIGQNTRDELDTLEEDEIAE